MIFDGIGCWGAIVGLGLGVRLGVVFFRYIINFSLSYHSNVYKSPLHLLEPKRTPEDTYIVNYLHQLIYYYCLQEVGLIILC